MIEIFKNIPPETRDLIKSTVDLIFQAPDIDNISALANYAANAPTEEIKSFIDFYVNLRFEQLTAQIKKGE